MNKYNLKHVVDKELKLKVNEVKTKLTSVYEGVRFLGFVIRTKTLGVDPKRVKRFKDKIRRITRRNWGWMNYYRVANIKGFTRDFIQWLCRRLRMVKMKQ
jgi:RNA-directed DNA polymerase